MTMLPHAFITRSSLHTDLDALGLTLGDTIMVHAAMRQVGSLMNGPDTLIAALRDVLGVDGTLIADSGDAASLFQYHAARHSDLMPPPWGASSVCI
jgi:aminoglycoside N3'-acetyltransferase